MQIDLALMIALGCGEISRGWLGLAALRTPIPALRIIFSLSPATASTKAAD